MLLRRLIMDHLAFAHGASHVRHHRHVHDPLFERLYSGAHAPDRPNPSLKKLLPPSPLSSHPHVTRIETGT